jgi:glycosyltransferase involved in cell wall biosynthesis
MSTSGPRSPRLTIGLPVYNGERYLPQSLSCLLSQTFGDFELILCDNASCDGTKDICLDFVARDSRLRYVRNERNLGAIPNFNRAFELGSAPFFKWAAHDDLYAPSYLAECMAILERNPEVVLAHSDTAFIGEDGEEFAWDSATGSYVDPITGIHQRPDAPDIGESASPIGRFWQVLSGALWGTHMFGVMRRPVLLKTRILENFVSSDRALLSELALLGRFETCQERLFKKRFHRQVSWALKQHELRDYLSTGDKAYSRRARQVRAFFGAPSDKPISAAERMICNGMVVLHCAKTLGQALTMKDRRNSAKAVAWRQNDGRQQSA